VSDKQERSEYKSRKNKAEFSFDWPEIRACFEVLAVIEEWIEIFASPFVKFSRSFSTLSAMKKHRFLIFNFWFV